MDGKINDFLDFLYYTKKTIHVDNIKKFFIYYETILGNKLNTNIQLPPIKYSKHYKRRRSFD